MTDMNQHDTSTSNEGWADQLSQAERAFDEGRWDHASELAREVLVARPDSAQALQVIGMVYERRDQPDKAIPVLERALLLQPDLPASQNVLGLSWYQLGDLTRALRCYDRCLMLNPNHASAHFNRALGWLKQGRFRDGWVEYEWRFATGQVSRPAIPVPRWDGSPLNGRSILVHTEQGLGDVFQFIRFLPLLKRQGARVVLACPTSLQNVLKSVNGVDEWMPIDTETAITFELYTPLLSLPCLLRIDSENDIPQNIPYVHADPQRVERWRTQIERLPGLRIGLCWQGSNTFRSDCLRSINLSHFARLADVPGVSLVSLQKGHGQEQIAENQDQLPITVLDGLDDDAAFSDTAAVMQHLDLVITTDTAIAHLAGAMGRPVWVAVAASCDWRYMEDRTDSPWYPTMRLFRQESAGDWFSVFHQLANALRTKLAERKAFVAEAAAGTVRTPVSFGELVDKITILEIKLSRLEAPDKVRNVNRELEVLTTARESALPSSPELDQLTSSLRRVNEDLWETEDEIRRCEADGNFGARFVELARSVYQTNDQRAVLKRTINQQFGSVLVEEKSYVDWRTEAETRKNI